MDDLEALLFSNDDPEEGRGTETNAGAKSVFAPPKLKRHKTNNYPPTSKQASVAYDATTCYNAARAPIQPPEPKKASKSAHVSGIVKSINRGYDEEEQKREAARMGLSKTAQGAFRPEKWISSRCSRVHACVKYLMDNQNLTELAITDDIAAQIIILSNDALQSYNNLSDSEKSLHDKSLGCPAFWVFALYQEAWARNNNGWMIKQDLQYTGNVERAETLAKKQAQLLSWEYMCKVCDMMRGQTVEIYERSEGNDANYRKRTLCRHPINYTPGKSKKTQEKFNTLDALLKKSNDQGIREEIKQCLPPEVFRYKPQPSIDDGARRKAKASAISKWPARLSATPPPSNAMADEINR